MHPIISDAAMSAAPPPPAVNVISPTEDHPVTIATTSTIETTQITPSYKPDAAMVTADDASKGTHNLINTATVCVYKFQIMVLLLDFISKSMDREVKIVDSSLSKNQVPIS